MILWLALSMFPADIELNTGMAFSALSFGNDPAVVIEPAVSVQS